jgi:hypothetical protein
MTIRIADEDKALIKDYAQMHGLSVAELMRSSVLERIEDEFDLRELREAMANPQAKFTPFEEVEAMFAND